MLVLKYVWLRDEKIEPSAGTLAKTENSVHPNTDSSIITNLLRGTEKS